MSNASTAALFEHDTHPRLFLDRDDVSSLRSKAKVGFGKRLGDEIVRRAEAYGDPASDVFVDPSATGDTLLEGMGGGRFNTTADALHCLSFAWLLTDDAAHRDRAIAILRVLVESPPRRGDICGRLLGNQVTLAFDLLHDALPPDLAQAVTQYITQAADAYQNAIGKPTHHHWNVGINTFQRDFEKLVVARAATMHGIALRTELERAARRFRQAVHLGLDDGGAIYEGPGYGRRDTEWLSFMAEIFLRAGVINMWDEEPRFAQMARNWAYLVLPGRRGQLDYCDAPRVHGNRPHVGALLHARRMDDPLCQWVWNMLSGVGAPVGDGPSPEAFHMHLGLILHWHDEDAVAHSPAQAGLAPSRLSGDVGLHTLRSGWDDDDLHFTLFSSVRRPACYIHQQVDAGHFNLFALGEAFSVDSGYGDIRGRYHSVIMPGGEEPSRAPEGFDQMWFGGHSDAFAIGTHADYARVSTGEQWEVPYAYRHALLVKAPGAQPYVVLFDNINDGPTMSSYRWQLNSEPENRIEVDAAAERAIVQGSVNRLEVAWAYPHADEYVEPHRLELSHDRIDSARRAELTLDADHRTAIETPATHPDGGTTGLGERPRLLADLHGYNGHLLTVMLPRSASEPTASIERLHAREQFGFRISLGDVVDTIIVSPITRHLDIDGLDGEATMTVVRRDASTDRVLWWCAADAYALSIDGDHVAPQRGRLFDLIEMKDGI